MSREHKLKACDTCGNNTEPLGGVQVRSKWYCARCWVKFLNGSIK